MTIPPTKVGRFGAALAASGLLAILGLTLYPNPRQAELSALTPLLCLVCGESGGADVILNLLLFLPLGAGLRLLGWRWVRVVAASALLSLGVETLQYLVVSGRDASLSDLITNTTGAGIGAALASRLGLLLAPDPVRAARLSLGAAAAWLGVLGASAFSMRPRAPEQPLRNYCTAGYPTSEVFSGTVRSMTLNAVPLPCDADLTASTAIAERLREGELRLEVTALSGDPTAGRRLIHVVRAPRTSLVLVGQQERSLVFSAPTAGQALRLLPPLVQLSAAFPPREGVPVEVRAEVHGRRVRLAAASEGDWRSMELALSPAHGWTAVLPGAIEPGAPLRLAGALWVGGLLLPAAYWAGHTKRPAGALGTLALVAIVGLGALPPLTGYPPAHWSEWLGAAGGTALGWALPHFGTYLQSRCGSPSTSAYSSS